MAFLSLERLKRYPAPLLRAILNSKITTKEYIMMKNVALNMPQKGHWFIVLELQQEDKRSPCPISAENVHLEHFEGER